MRSTPSRCSTSNRNGRERHPLAQARDVGRAGGAGPGDLERRRPPVVEQDDRLAVEHEVAPGQRGDGLDHLGHPLGDLVEAARVDRDLARPRGAPGCGCRRACRRRAGRRHRPPPRPRLRSWPRRRASGAPAAPRRAPPARAPRPRRAARAPATSAVVPASMAARRTTGIGHGVRRRDGGEHHAVEGALAQVAGDEVDEEALLVGRRAAHQPGQLGPAGCRRAGTRGGRQAGEGGVDLDDGEAGLGRPARAATPASGTRRPRRRCGSTPDRCDDHQPHLGRVATGEEVGQGLGLGRARPGGRDGARGGDDLGERDVHPLILPRRTDSRASAPSG